MARNNRDKTETQTRAPLTLGTRVGHYQIDDWIGAGGIGRVYLAIDTSNKSKVAIKSVDLRRVDRAALEKEIAALKALDHERIVKYIESFDWNERIHIVTEYIEGKTLSKYIKGGRLDFESITRYASQILDALDYIHEMGLIHSDLKPSNIIVDADDNIKLIDFGIARTASAEIAADIKDIRGTLHYMSPEQAEGKPYDIRSDIFAFGIILYELCTGRRPFHGEYDMAVVYSILYEDPVPPGKLSAFVSPELSSVIMRFLSKDPADRPGSAGEAKRLFLAACREEWGEIQDQRKRLAILPFSYPEGDNESRLLAQGLNEEFYSALHRVEELDVVPPVKVEPHAGDLVDGAAVRALLGADYYLKGTLRRSADRVRIYFTLTTSVNDSVVWSDKFDSPLGNLFDVIDAIAETVLVELKVTLFPRTTTASAATTANPEAYELYLLARSYYIKFNKKDLKYARDIFTQALRIDPDYSLAYVGLADCHCVEYVNYFDRSEGNIASAIAWAERALELTPHLPEAYRSLGRIMQAIGKPDEAQSHYIKAVTYNGDYYQAYRSLGWLAADSYRYDEAIEWVRKSLSIKSTDIETILLIGMIHLDRKESTLAINDFTRCVELRPDYGRAYFFMGMAYYQLGRIDEAITELERALELGGDINTPYLLGYYHLAKGEYDRARQVLKTAATYREIAFLAEFNLGLLDLLQGRKKAAAEQFRISRRQCRELLDSDDSFVVARATLGKNLALLDRRQDCLELIDDLRRVAAFDGSIAHDLAHIHAILGNTTEAEKYIKHASKIVRGPTGAELEIDPLLRYFMK